MLPILRATAASSAKEIMYNFALGGIHFCKENKMAPAASTTLGRLMPQCNPWCSSEGCHLHRPDHVVPPASAALWAEAESGTKKIQLAVDNQFSQEYF